jgi:hypothetical protein
MNSYYLSRNKSYYLRQSDPSLPDININNDNMNNLLFVLLAILLIYLLYRKGYLNFIIPNKKNNKVNNKTVNTNNNKEDTIDKPIINEVPIKIRQPIIPNNNIPRGVDPIEDNHKNLRKDDPFTNKNVYKKYYPHIEWEQWRYEDRFDKLRY